MLKLTIFFVICQRLFVNRPTLIRSIYLFDKIYILFIFVSVLTCHCIDFVLLLKILIPLMHLASCVNIFERVWHPH